MGVGFGPAILNEFKEYLADVEKARDIVFN